MIRGVEEVANVQSAPRYEKHIMSDPDGIGEKKRHKKISISEFIFRIMACLFAFGLEIVGDFVGAVGPLVGRYPEIDQSQSRTELDEARVLSYFGQADLEQH